MSRKLVIAAISLMIAAGLSTGCSLFKKKPTSARGGGPGSETPVQPLAPGAETGVGERPIDMGNLVHGQFTPVYFDYDSARIKPSEFSKLKTVADYVKANSGKTLIIEGHCDERGTAEYNRALGERRALAAREELAKLGVDAKKVSTVSYGNERPVEPLHNESAWSKNRRCEFATTVQ